jgi:REP element-mobilizing transposase RayT
MTLLNRDRQGATPNTYLITFACYGTWLPGQAGAVPTHQNQFGNRLPEANPKQEDFMRARMKQEPYFLDSTRRQLVLETIQKVGADRGWTLLAAHVRSTHVHIVIDADSKPELVMNAFKAHSSRALNDLNIDNEDSRRWARHGSTRYLWTRDAINAAIRYVVRGQGEPMAVYEAANF